MADGDLRALEQRCRQTGDRADEEAYQRARVRAGLPQLAIVLKLSTRFLNRRPNPDPSSLLDDLLTELGARTPHLVLDGTRLRHISSTELGLLVKHADRLMNAGGTLALGGLSPSIGIVIEMLGLEAFFTLYESVDEALEARGWEVLLTVDHVLKTNN